MNIIEHRRQQRKREEAERELVLQPIRNAGSLMLQITWWVLVSATAFYVVLAVLGFAASFGVVGVAIFILACVQVVFFHQLNKLARVVNSLEVRNEHQNAPNISSTKE